MSQVGKHHSEEKVNGDVSSPSKVPKMEGSPEERLAKVKDFFGNGGPKPPPPKPKPKKFPPVHQSENTNEGKDTPPYSPLSPGMEDPGSIVLDMESLSQLSTIMEIDLDAVVREQEILENQALKDRAALSQSKGLQTRRLPKNYVSKVPVDYADRRRAQSYTALSTALSSEGTDGGSTPEISEEERKQRILSRSGISQGSNPLAALGNILKRKNSLRGRKSPKSPKKDKKTDSPRSTPKMKKKDSLGTPDAASVSKGFFGSLRRSGSRNSGRKKGKFDSVSATASANVSTEDLRADLRADNASVLSMPIHPSPRRLEDPVTTSTPIKKPNYEREADSPTTPQHTTIATKTPLNDRSFASPDNHRNSSLFREPSVEKLFDSDSSNLFGSSELAAFFMKEKESTPERSIPESKKEESKEVEAPPTSKVEVKASILRQPESKSNIRSRLHAYERASTSDSTSKPPPLVEEGSKDEQKEVKQGTKDEKKESVNKDTILKESAKPVPRGSKGKKDDIKKEPTNKVSDLFDDLEDDDLFGPTKTPTSPSSKPSAQSDLDKKKASLFEDELFQDDAPKSKPPPVKKEPPKVMPKKPKKSIDGSPKRETNKETVKISKPSSVVVKTDPTITTTAEKSVTKETKEEPKVEEPKKEEKKPDTISSSFFDDDSELPVYGLRRKARSSRSSQQSVTETETTELPKSEEKPKIDSGSKASPKSEEKPKIGGGLFDDDSSDLPPFGLRRKRRDKTNDGGLFDDPVEPPRYGRQTKAAREREELDSAADSLFADVDKEVGMSEAEAEVSKVTTTEDKTQLEKESEKREKDKEATKDKSPDLFEDDKIDGTTKEEVVNISPEVEIREPTPDKEADKEADKEVTIEPPKETKTDDKKVSRRDRSATELGTSATTGKAGKTVVDKKSGKPEPSWMADLKKKRESGEKSTSTTVKKTTSTKLASSAAAKDDEEVPEWQKRVFERRKNRAAAASSPKTTGRLSAKTETTTSTRSATKSPTAGRKSPNTSRKSPVPGKKSEQKSTAGTERKSRFDRDKDDRGFSQSVDVTSSRKTTTKTSVSLKTSSTKEVKPTEPKEETDSPKPKLSKKPSIEVVSKIIRVSSSKSPRGSTTSPEPATRKESKSAAEDEDEVFVEGKAAVEKKSPKRTSSPKLSVDRVSSDSTSAKESSTTTESAAKESVTSEKASVEENSTEADKNPSKSTSSTSSERERAQSPPFRSHSISRSPTPTSPTGPLKLKTDSDIPEWKKKLLEKKTGTTPVTKKKVTTSVAAKKEPELPAWKKELLARKQATSTERKPRSATVAVSKPSSSSTTRAGRRDKDKAKETPAFMKEFQKKKEKSKS